jgi:hypothetical protein
MRHAAASACAVGDREAWGGGAGRCLRLWGTRGGGGGGAGCGGEGARGRGPVEERPAVLILMYYIITILVWAGRGPVEERPALIIIIIRRY